MKVTKRDGRVVDYDRNKIIVAIQRQMRRLTDTNRYLRKRSMRSLPELKISMWIICRWKIFRT